ncbi:prepilin-type N-terminal cleavage/methylation domain-containing protein [Myxococcota bacterium]|nr:prepilin-type N-terminal cleavage/methylation domain-containing protein [Myxococcota bacterium]
MKSALKKIRENRKGQRGISLIETLIAAFVFTVGALALLNLIVIGSFGVESSNKITIGTILARDKLNELMQSPYADIVTAQETTNINSQSQPAGAFGTLDGKSGFARSWTVSIPDASLGFKLINVEVAWTGPNGKSTHRVNITGGKSSQ